jgi:DNA-directed RNA polymerase specialized sigma24 family protein
MRFSAGFSHEEIAKVCGIGREAVSARIKKIAEELNAMRKAKVVFRRTDDKGKY